MPKQFNHFNMFSLCSYSLTRLASFQGSTTACDFKNTNVLENTLIESILPLKNEHTNTACTIFCLTTWFCSCFLKSELVNHSAIGGGGDSSPSISSAFNVGNDYDV